MKQRGAANIFLIILGIFIVFILFGYFRNKSMPYLNLGGMLVNPTSKINTTPAGSLYSSCGINIYSPLNFGTVDNVFEFSGKVNGCGWNQQNGFIGTLEVLNDVNASLTDKVAIPVNSDGSFKVSIALKNKSTNGAGLLVFQSLDQLQIATLTIYFK